MILSLTDIKKSKFSKTNPLADSTFPGVEYGSQSYYIVENDVIYSSGSYGQQGDSDIIWPSSGMLQNKENNKGDYRAAENKEECLCSIYR